MFKHTVEERHVCNTIKEDIEAASIKTSIHYRLAKPFISWLRSWWVGNLGRGPEFVWWNEERAHSERMKQITCVRRKTTGLKWQISSFRKHLLFINQFRGSEIKGQFPSVLRTWFRATAHSISRMTTAVEEGSATVPPLHPYLSAGRAREGSVKCDVAKFRRPRFEVTQNVDKLFCALCTGPNSLCLVTELCLIIRV